MRKTIGTCSDCKYWDEKEYELTRSEILKSGRKIKAVDFIECKKRIMTPMNGNWGCIYWKKQ